MRADKRPGIMKIEDELEKYQSIKYHIIKSLENRIELIDADLVGVGGITYSDLPKGQGHKTSTKREKMIIEKDNIKGKIERYKQFLALIEDSVLKLDELEGELITECYLRDKMDRPPNYSICEVLHMSLSKFYRIKKRAIKNLAVLLYGED